MFRKSQELLAGRQAADNRLDSESVIATLKMMGWGKRGISKGIALGGELPQLYGGKEGNGDLQVAHLQCPAPGGKPESRKHLFHME